MSSLGIGQLTAIELDPTDYVAVAAEAGLEAVSLFINPMGSIEGSCLTGSDNCAAVKQQLRATGLRVANVECFPIVPGLDVESYSATLDIGAELGASSATMLLYDPDETRVIDSLSRMCELCDQRGMNVGIEFMPLAAGWTTIGQTAELIASVGQSNLGMGIDLLHLIRSGGTPADVAATPPGLIHYAQLCDSNSLAVTNDYVEEASAVRLAPGEGKFPTLEFLQALPAGTPLELEVPQPPDIDARQRVRGIAEAARRQMKLAGI